MSTRYQPDTIEPIWRKRWQSDGAFQSKASSDNTYTMMLPPPNVTGSLHMGHAFSQTLMDILIRYHRMDGFNTLWQGGTDHAGIATQMMVERQLNQAGTSRVELGREGFLDAVWRWKEESGGTITNQMNRLGTSIDWTRGRFTMDPELSHSTREAFIRLYQDGLIYQGNRLVNWDPVLKTALSDLEVESVPSTGSLWHIRYPLSQDPSQHLVVATTRPETLLGDSGVAVHPEDERYRSLIGQTVTLPFCNREIPIVADDAVDMAFGTGCVKVTPAHDFNDYEIGQRHGLSMINILNEDASLVDSLPAPFAGMSREDARKEVVKQLDERGLLEKTEKHDHVVPTGDRSGAVLEPRLTKQWYLKMEDLAKPAIDALDEGSLRFIPDNWKKTYLQWLENIQDWCLSRQLWWGHRIPAWFDESGHVYVGHSEQAVRDEHNLGSDVALTQDNDVLDTWFSSSLWPFATLGWPEKTPDFTAFFPTQILVTGFDIIFFWVARMVMMSLYFTGKSPFSTVYIHGLVRDKNGQKMSKTKGNVIDPIDVIDGISLEKLLEKRISKLINPKHANQVKQMTQKQFPQGIPAHGTDALRFTFTALAGTGRDINFDFARVEGYRNFCNKLWNAGRFIQMTHADYQPEPLDPQRFTLADKWILSSLQDTIASTRESIANYRFDLLAQTLYEFTWNHFCDWYLEASKTQMDECNRSQTQAVLSHVMHAILRMLHPITPFITEELAEQLSDLLGRNKATLLVNEPYPRVSEEYQFRKEKADFEQIQSLIRSIRQTRSEIGLSPAKSVPTFFCPQGAESERLILSESVLIQQLAKLEKLTPTNDPNSLPASASAHATVAEVFIPLAGYIDKDMELTRLAKQISKLIKESEKIDKKLQNERFLSQAPEAVIEQEKEKSQEIGHALKRLHSHQAIISQLEEV